MNETQKQTLLEVARDAVDAAINKKTISPLSTDDPQLNAHCGCFVTLKNKDQLRGCIGQFTSDKPLIELVSQMAIASATNDSRFTFDAITSAELKQLELDISVLSLLKKTDDPLSLRIGVDGIYIIQGHNSGCFLPQVATETGWTKEQFLSYCCSQKAGLLPTAWKDPQTEVYLFTAEVFGAKFADV